MRADVIEKLYDIDIVQDLQSQNNGLKDVVLGIEQSNLLEGLCVILSMCIR